ncbi:MAG: hypothetical protein ETSY2_15935 [Candidatus Entotheonella gemina]|uniref:Uncharacterized protein n=1 Tax=Candidatus Entotheonella gemina TaxID=1429439 RepID=W4MAH0_9BACT|nr:MAG: hypothetical protein ETSY2_15935 [Candidatus Entotheonella gemina]
MSKEIFQLPTIQKTRIAMIYLLILLTILLAIKKSDLFCALYLVI